MRETDARLKLLFLFLLLGLQLFSSRPLFILFSAVISLVLALAVRPRISHCKRLLFPITFALLFLLVHVVLGDGPRMEFTLFGLQAVYAAGGLAEGGILALRITAGAFAFFWFVQATSLPDISAALAWLRVPAPVIAILGMTWRYLSVYEEEVARMRQARVVRLGFAHWRTALVSVAAVGGHAVIRAFDHSERTYRAMVSRGYHGCADTAPPVRLPPCRPSTAKWLLLPVILLLIAFMVL